MALGQYDVAILQLNDALRLDDKNYVAYIQLARLHRARKDYEQALAILALCGNTVNVQSLVDIASIYVGVKEDQGKLQEGLTWLEGRVAAMRGDVELDLMAAEFFIKHGEDRRALDIYQGLSKVALSPRQQIEQLAGLGKLRWTMHRDRDGALSYFYQALGKSPGNQYIQALIDSVQQASAAGPGGASAPRAPSAPTSETLRLAAPSAPAPGEAPVSGSGLSLGGQ
jgi:tetratricopeptide (TPR) repeat protein